MDETLSTYKLLAERLDALPNGFPPTEDGVELRLLAKLFSPEEAGLAAQLGPNLETAPQVAERLGFDPQQVRLALKGMARRGLIAAGRTPEGMGYGLMPFVVGIYEMQAGAIDVELAQLFEDYYTRAFKHAFAAGPPVHRVIPVGESVRTGMEVRPFEDAAEIVRGARAWGVVDCICRTQQALIGKGCDYPRDVCLAFSDIPGFFDRSPTVRALTQDEALATLQRAADAGLVHTVSNNQQGLWYVCNCCTCCCGILRGMVELGAANVVARSAFVNQVDPGLCIGCGSCVEHCPFGALSVEETAEVNGVVCVGCGVCVPVCPQAALSLVRRPVEEVLPPPVTEADWRSARAAARGLSERE